MSSPSPSLAAAGLFAGFSPATAAAWRTAAEESLDGAPFEKKLITRTPEGIDLQPIYTREQWQELPLRQTWPGVAPYVRGTSALGARTAGWWIAQELPYGQPEQFNAALLHDLNRGQNAVNLLFDPATRLGLDPDEAEAGEVGGCGLSLATLPDLERALRGVDLAAVPLYAPAGAAALPVAAMFSALLAERGQTPAVLRGSLTSDPVADWVRRGQLPVGVDASIDDMATLTRWGATAAPELRVIGVQAALWADAGGHAVQELAFGLATGVDYLRHLAARAVALDEAASRVLFTFSLGSTFFTEVAKLRAARLLWARALAAAGASPAAQRLAIHGRCSLANKTTLDAHANLLRATTEAFAGAIGGCESLHVAAFDETYHLSDDFARRVARNTQIILAEECHLGRVVDPAGGSYYLETLTLQLAEKAWALFQEIERRGGMIAALQAGFPQAEVARSAAARQGAVESRRDSLVGTNVYPNLRETLPALELPDYAGIARQRATQVRNYRVASDAERGAEVLARLAGVHAADAGDRVAALTAAFSAGATLGEVTKVLHAAHPGTVGAAIPKVGFARRAAPFEKLRRRAEAFRQRTGALPAVFLATFGPRKQHAARAEFSTGFFAAGGFSTVSGKSSTTPEEAAAAALASAAPIVVLCSTDETYPTLVPPCVAALKAAARPPLVVLAGLPATPELQAQFKAAGVDEFIHLRANCAQLLAGFQDRLGL